MLPSSLSITKSTLDSKPHLSDADAFAPCRRLHREFRLADDMYAQDSIELLKLSGINFAETEARGIDFQSFGELLMSSGIVLNEEVSDELAAVATLRIEALLDSW